MKVLLIHNKYGAYSGEESVVDKQVDLFKSMGYDVSLFTKTSEGSRDTLIGKMKGFFSGFYSYSSVKKIKKILRNDLPDIVVVHNLYPYISPAILKFIRSYKVPVIMTVHNYRLMCPTGLFMRNFKPCELCLKGAEFNCILHNCESSYFKSIAYAARNWYARITKAYINNVTQYACLTKFQTEKLIQAGYGKDKLEVIPNFLTQIPPYEFLQGSYVAVSGRLSKEKGINLILDLAKRTPHIQYKFAGNGNIYDFWTDKLPDNCIILGHLNKKELDDFYKKSKFLLVGSLWYEGFPMTILDAFSWGKPAVVPGHAGFLEMIDDKVNGSHYVPGDIDDMQEKVVNLWFDDVTSEKMGQNAYQKLKNQYSKDNIKLKWQKLFNRVLSSL